MIQSISIIIPRHHESKKQIHQAIEKVRAYFTGKPFKVEIIVSENGCRSRLGKVDGVQVLSNSDKGLGVALRMGITAANGDFVYILSSDVPFKFTDLDQFICNLDSYDLMFASKLHSKSIYKINWIRYLGTHYQHWITKLFFPSFPISDPNGSFMGKTSVIKLLAEEIHANNYFFTTELALIGYFNNSLMKEVPITYIKTDSVSSVNIIVYGLSFLQQIMSMFLKRSWNWLKQHYIILLLLGLIAYVSPLFNYQNNVAGLKGDSLGHAPYTVQFCDQTMHGVAFTNKLFALTGANIAANYDFPTLAGMACLLRPLGPIAMFNFIVVVQMLLILITSYLVAKKYLRSKALQIAFIFLYGFCAFMLARSQYHINLLSTVWGTSLAFYLFCDLDLMNRKQTLTAFGLLALIFGSSWQNIPNLFIPILIILLTKLLIKPVNISRIFNVGLGVLFGVLVAFPLMQPIMHSYAKGASVPATIDRSIYNADLLSYVIPVEQHWLHSFFIDIIHRIELRDGYYFEKINAFDPMLLLLAGYFLYQQRRQIPTWLKRGKILIAIALFSALMASGPALELGASKLIDLPYFTWLSKFPPYSVTRTPARMGIVVVFLGYVGFFWILDQELLKSSNKRYRHWANLMMSYAIISTTLLSQNLTYPHTFIPTFIPLKGLAEIKADPINDYVLNLPLAFLNDPSQNFLQIYHDKPIITGNVSYSVLTTAMTEAINKDEVLKHLDCYPDGMRYYQYLDRLSNNIHSITDDLLKKNIRYIVVNKHYLSVTPHCEGMQLIVDWIYNHVESFQILDENSNYVIYKIL